MLYQRCFGSPVLPKPTSNPTLLTNIVTPLAKHPDQTSGRNNNWPCQTPTPRRRFEEQPLAHEMSPCNSIGAHCELVDLGIGYVVGSIETDDGRDDGPGTEDS